MTQLPIKDLVSDALRLSVREPRVFVTLSWVSLLVSTAMFMSAYLAQDRTVKTVVAAIACILQRVFDTESLSRLMGEMFVAPQPPGITHRPQRANAGWMNKTSYILDQAAPCPKIVSDLVLRSNISTNTKQYSLVSIQIRRAKRSLDVPNFVLICPAPSSASFLEGESLHRRSRCTRLARSSST